MAARSPGAHTGARRAQAGAQLSRSLGILRALGFASWAIEYYRQQARQAGRLPHEIVRAIAAQAARTTIGPALRRPRSPARPAAARARGPAQGERRASSLAGLMRRQTFQASIDLLRGCRFDAWTLRCYRDAAPAIRMLPHDLVRSVAETVAWNRLNRDAERDRKTNGHTAPSVLLLRNALGGVGPIEEDRQGGLHPRRQAGRRS
jgi:hypothetical protein